MYKDRLPGQAPKAQTRQQLQHLGRARVKPVNFATRYRGLMAPLASDCPRSTKKDLSEVDTAAYVAVVAWLRKHGKVRG